MVPASSQRIEPEEAKSVRESLRPGPYRRQRASLPNNLHQDALAAFAVEFAIEDLLPGTEVKSTVGNCHDYFSAHDLALEVSIRVVFSRAVMLVLVVGACGASLSSHLS